MNDHKIINEHDHYRISLSSDDKIMLFAWK